MYTTKIWGHRGASGCAPENTIEAFLLAAEQGADGVELDVQMTRDGELVVIHDESIGRVSNGTGLVKDFTLEELRSFHFNKTHPEYSHAKIPTLAEVYECMKPLGLTVNVELKTGIYWYPGLEEAVLKLTRDMGMEERVIYSSFNHRSIAKVKALDPGAHTAILYTDVTVDTVSYAEKLGVEALHPGVWHMKMDGLMEEWIHSSLKVNVWTVNDVEDMKLLMEAGVHAIITNYPALAAAVRKEG